MLTFLFHMIIECASSINDLCFLITKPCKNILDRGLFESVTCCNNLIKKYNATINKPRKYEQLIDSCPKKQKILNEASTLTVEFEILKQWVLCNIEVITQASHDTNNTEQFKNELNVLYSYFVYGSNLIDLIIGINTEIVDNLQNDEHNVIKKRCTFIRYITC